MNLKQSKPNEAAVKVQLIVKSLLSEAKIFFLPIVYTSKQKILIENKVWVNQALSFLFFAKHESWKMVLLFTLSI